MRQEDKPIEVNIRKPFFGRRKISIAASHRDDTSLHSICRNIDAYFRSTDSRILKNDHSSTVLSVHADHQLNVVLRRDNFKRITTYLKRLIRKSRSRKIWEKGRSMKKFGLKTIDPIALVEDYQFLIRTASYVVCAYIGGLPLGKYFSHPDIPEDKKRAIAHKLVQDIDQWHALGVAHGDPKASNILIEQDDIYLIDVEDIKFPKTNYSRKHAITRDKYIILHNWQKHPPYRDAWIRKFVLKDQFGKHYFGRRLVKKFWKDEYPILARSFSKGVDAGKLLESIHSDSAVFRWLNWFSCRRSAVDPQKKGAYDCIVSQRAFWGARTLSAYFQKKRVPQKGVFSMALALRICGFLLPDIVDAGVLKGLEYVVFDNTSARPVQAVWKKLPENSSLQNDFITKLAEEIGCLHALGFIGVIQSLDSIFVREEHNSFDVGFKLNCAVRYYPGRNSNRLVNETDIIEADFLSRIPSRESSLFWGKYKEIVG